MEKMGIEEAALREWFLKREGKRVYRYPLPKSRSGGGGWVNRVYALWYDRGVYIWPGLYGQLAKDCVGSVVRYFDTKKERDAYKRRMELELKLKQIGRYGE